MSLADTFTPYKAAVSKFLTGYVSHELKRLGVVNDWADDVEKRLQRILTKGKMTRASLVCFAYECKGKKITPDVIKVASAIELVHMALLVHDDIMDEDTLRRGERTLYAQYQDLAARTNCRNPNHFGESLGICVGDILIFLGFQLIGTLDSVNAKQAQRVVQYFSSELSAVALAQMQDMYFGATRREITKKDVLQMYQYKTARYSFSLPLAVGSIMAKQDEATIKSLEEYGEAAGLIFQIRDDELGLFGTVADFGKPIGSDVREGKRTIYSTLLFKRATPVEQASLQTIFGNPDITEKHIGHVQSVLKKYGIPDEVAHLISNYERDAKRLINGLKLGAEHKQVLKDLLEHALKRNS